MQRLQAVGPRATALASADVLSDAITVKPVGTPGRWTWGTPPLVPEVPRELLVASRWDDVLAKPWIHKDEIHVREGVACMNASWQKVRAVRAQGRRHLALTDSMR